MEINGFGWHERPRPPSSQELPTRRGATTSSPSSSSAPIAACSSRTSRSTQVELQLHRAVELVQAAGRDATRRRKRPSSSTTRPRVSTGWRHEPQHRRVPRAPGAVRRHRRRPPARAHAARRRTTSCSAACAFTTSTGGPRACRPWSSCTAADSMPIPGTSCAPSLRRERHCVALDQRGHGESEWSPEMDYATESHAATSSAFVDALRPRALRAGGHVAGRRERAGVGRTAQPAPRRAGPGRRRSRDPRRGRPQDRRVHLGGHAARLRRAVRRPRARLQSTAQPRAPAAEPAAQPPPDARRPLHVEVRPAPPRPSARSRRPSRAGGSSCGRRWTASSVRRSSCAAPRATSSTTRTPSAWPAASARGAG